MTRLVLAAFILAGLALYLALRPGTEEQSTVPEDVYVLSLWERVAG